MSSEAKKLDPASIVLAPQKKSTASAAISLRPQRGPAAGSSASSSGAPSGSAFSSSSPTRSSGFADAERGQLQYSEPAESFPEIPTDLNKRIYTRASLHEYKTPMSRLPDAETVNAMRGCSVWTDSIVSAQSLAQTLPSGPYMQRDQRGGKGQQQGQKNRMGPGGQGGNASNRGGGNGGMGGNSNRSGSPSGKSTQGGGGSGNFGSSKPSDGAKGGSRPQKKKDEQEMFFGQIQSLLNKLTLEKFDKLCGKLVDLFKTIDTPETLEYSVELVHKKALTEPHFCSMYSDLCERLSKESPEFPDPDGGKKPLGFSKLILNDCQKVFLERLPVGDVSEEIMNKARKRILGNLVFIGELYKRNLIHQNIVQRCVNDLASEVQKGVAQLHPEQTHEAAALQAAENNIEKLCKIVSSVAKTWEARNPTNKTWMDQLFELLKDFASNNVLNPRTRFLVRDVIDMRLNGWIPRRRVEGPQKLDDIKLQAELEYDGLIAPAEMIQLKTVPAAEFEKRARENDAQRARAASGGSASAPSPAKPAVNRLGPAPAVEDEDVATEALQEYLNSGDMHELSLSVRELKSLDKFVTAVVDWAFQKNPTSSAGVYKQIAEVFVGLKNQKALTSDHFVHGFSVLTSSLDDIVVDVPHAVTTLGFFLGNAARNGVISEQQLDSVVNSVPTPDLRTKLSAAATQV
eukprot:TRINITY_DN2073_c0_g1_i1.p1 TRINITY_DN2073_c0_g1~~TRINITY_DN2073_c0_g1_i1.p1  ORF type:complete len:686 (-),score=183.64 TRINITY_DN2073_c0_g1_i1:36-2093(-)